MTATTILNCVIDMLHMRMFDLKTCTQLMNIIISMLLVSAYTYTCRLVVTSELALQKSYRCQLTTHRLAIHAQVQTIHPQHTQALMITSDSDGPLHGDITFGHFRIRLFGRCLVGGQKCTFLYCDDWEKGANRIVVRQCKWLLQRNYHICKIQAHRPFHASLIGVVTGIGEQRYI